MLRQVGVRVLTRTRARPATAAAAARLSSMSLLQQQQQQQQQPPRASNRGSSSSDRNHGRLQPRRVQSRSLFIQTEKTPNPDSLKFLPGRPVLPQEHGSGVFLVKGDRDYQRSPLAVQLFTIDGVANCFLGPDFVTVGRENPEKPTSASLTPADLDWRELRPQVFSVLMDCFTDGVLVIDDTPVVSDTTILDDDDEIVAMIKELLETRIRPAVQEDGGDIFYAGFDEGTGVSSVGRSLATFCLCFFCVGCASF